MATPSPETDQLDCGSALNTNETTAVTMLAAAEAMTSAVFFLRSCCPVATCAPGVSGVSGVSG